MGRKTKLCDICYKEMIMVKGLKNGARKELMTTVASASFVMYR